MEPSEITAMIARLIEREGGYVDHPNDAGGCTKFGITRATLQAHRGRDTACADVRALHEAEAVAIYRARYVEHRRLKLEQWPYRKLAEVTLDAAVMWSDGPERAARWAQEAINAMRPAATPIATDGWAGPATLAAMVLCDQRQLVAYVIGARCRAHAEQVRRAPSQAAFIAGWISRATAWIMVANGNGAERPEPAPEPEPEPAPAPVVPEVPDHPSRWPLSARRWVVRRKRHNVSGTEYWTGLHVGPQGETNPVVSLDPSKAERWIDEQAALAAVRAYDDRMLGHGFVAHRLEEWGE